LGYFYTRILCDRYGRAYCREQIQTHCSFEKLLESTEPDPNGSIGPQTARDENNQCTEKFSHSLSAWPPTTWRPTAHTHPPHPSTGFQKKFNSFFGLGFIRDAVHEPHFALVSALGRATTTPPLKTQKPLF
jgi:hypothetical protein